MEDTTGATATQMLPSDPDEFVAQLNEAAGRRTLWPWALLAVIVVALAAPAVVGAVVAIVGLAAVVWLYLRDRARRSTVAFFQVEGPQADWFGALVDSFGELGSSSGLWRVNASGDVTTTYQYKVNSGASTLISRAAAAVDLSGPKALVTNIAVPSVASGGHSLHFLPDRMLVRDGRKFASVSYAALETQVVRHRFIETKRVPRDARQVDTTWRYVNVKGGPDRRFKDNPQLPVMLYGRITLTAPRGLRWIIDVSRTEAADNVAATLRGAAAPAPVSAPAA